MTETWTADQCAEHWSVTPATWRKYVSQQRAPEPLPGYDEQRRRRWDAEAVKNWQRRGQGWRRGKSGPHRN